MNTFVFQPGSTWRKLGYAFFSDSLSYREVLKANPFWDITKTPAPGTLIYKPEETNESSGGGGLIQSGSTVNVNISNTASSSFYYPFDTEQTYRESLSRYNAASLSNIERYNGWTTASVQSQTGFQ